MKQKILFFLLYGIAIFQLIFISFKGNVIKGEIEVSLETHKEEVSIEKFFEKLNDIDSIKVEEVKFENGENIGKVAIEGDPKEVVKKIEALDNFKVTSYNINEKGQEIEVKLSIKEE